MSLHWGALTLGMGTISAHFQVWGMSPSLKEELKISAIGVARWPDKSLRTQVGIPSGADAFLTSSLNSYLSTSSTDTWYLSDLGALGCWCVGVSLEMHALIGRCC